MKKEEGTRKREGKREEEREKERERGMKGSDETCRDETRSEGDR
jgi:hypothetical protein